MADKSLNLGTIFTANATQFFTEIGKMRTALGTLNSAYAQTGTAAKKGLGAIAPAIDKTNKSFDKGGASALAYSKQIGKVEGAFQRTVAAMKVTASYGIAATAIFAVTNAFKAGIKEIVDFDQALKNLQAITQATDAEVMGMGETIKQVAKTTKFSTGEVADGMVLLGQAGFSATEAMNAMQAVANLATGTLGDMKTVTDLLTTTVRAFNLDTVESSRVADVMANAINRSKLTIDKLRIAFNFVGAAAAQSGLSIEEVSASMMLLANNGLRASTIGTGMRQVLARLLAPNRRLREEFQAQGIELDKINPKTVGYQNAMKELTKVLYDAETKTVDMGKAYQLFGLRGAQAVSVLVKGFAGTGFQNMLDKTYEVGTASDMAAKQMEGLGVAFKNLMDRAKLLFVSLGEGGLTHTLKVFVQILKGATIAIAAFLESGIGQLIISASALTGSFYLLLKGIGLLIPQIIRLGKVMLVARLATSAWFASFLSLGKQMGYMTAASISLGTTITKLSHPYLLVAAAIGVVVAAINHYLGRTQRAIDATIKMSQQSISNVHALNVYGAAIDSINEKRKKGAKVEGEYIAVLKRLIEAYPELEGGIKLTTAAHEENARVIKEVLGKEVEKTIKQNTELLTLYDKQARQIRILHGLWLKMKSLNPFEGIIDGLVSSIEKISDSGSEIDKTGKRSKNILEELGRGSEKAMEVEKERLKVLEATAAVMEKAGKPVKTIIRTLEEMGGKESEIRKISEAFEDQEITLKELENRYKSTARKSENIFKDFYENLDAMRKSDFTKAMSAADNEIAANRKKEEELTGIAKTRYDVEAAIRAKHLMEFADDAYEEVLSYKTLQDEKKKILDNWILKVIENYDKETIAIHNAYQRELEAAQGNKEKLLEAEERFNAKIAAEAEKRAKTIEGIHRAHNERIRLEQAKLVEELRKMHVKIAEDMVSQLKSKFDTLKSEIEKLMSDLKSLDDSYNEAMRESKQKTMTEEEKFYDDRKELDRLMNEARRTNDADTWKQAFELAKSLGRAVTDENGKVIKDIEETTRLSQNLMTEIHAEQMKLLKEEIATREQQMGKIKADITELEGLIKQYGEAVDEVSKKELLLKMEKALESIGAAHKIVTQFKEKWDELKSKVITLTVNVVKTGSGSDDFNTGPDIVPEGKTGGIAKLQRGRKLPGFGGGDKVRALLEAGEWVIKKEAVKKYGSALFEALNNMSFNIEDLLGGAMKRMGGMIAQPVPAVAKYQTGGEVGLGGSARGSGAGNTYQITFAPQFMTGDAMAMRNMAPELKRILEDLDHRWGR